MKVGIMTQPLGMNYGGVLQAYALQNALSAMGHSVDVVARQFYEPWYRRVAMRGMYFYTRNIKGIKIDKKSRFQNIRDFRDREISMTTPVYTTAAVTRLGRRYDAFVVGSDQVWRVDYTPKMVDFFLCFLRKRKDVKRIAYAASFGVDEWQFNESDTALYKDLIGLFDGVSVREDSAVDLCRKYFGVPAELVLDPTLLLDASDYQKLLDDDREEKTVMAYILDKSDSKTKALEKVSKQIGLPAKNIYQVLPVDEYKRGADVTPFMYPAVEDWLRAFRDAEFVVTDSFHGCVFSIIFNKPFIAIGNRERGLTRFTSLVKLFDLEDRLVFGSDEITPELIAKKIDWEHVNETRQRLKIKSLKFLEDNLK